jgi:YD repeat-containing protein
VTGPITTDATDTAVSLNGTTQRVAVGTWTTPATVEAWVKLPARNTAELPVFSNRDTNSSPNKSMLYFGLSEGRVFIFENARRPLSMLGTSRVDDGGWHQIAYTWDGSTGRIYVDGALETSLPQSDTLPLYTSAASIGYDLANGQFFPGSIDEVAVYASALSADRVSAHYSASGQTQRQAPTVPRSVYANAVLADRPFAYYRLSESAGATTTADASGNGYDGTYVGSPALAAAGPLAGEPTDHAVSLNGTTQQVTTPVQHTPPTVEAWIKLPAPNTGTLPVVSNREGQTARNMIFFGLNAGKVFVYVNSRSPVSLTGTTRIDDGAWHQIAYTFDGSVGRLYVDGALQTAATQSEPTWAWKANVQIGYDVPNNSRFPGSIDEVALYSNALSAAQIKAHFDAAGRIQEPVEQTYGTCGSNGVHALSPSECLADPVNSASGAYTSVAVDLSLPGAGIPFSFTRNYTSADATSGRLGRGWSDSYSASLKVQANGDVVLHGEDGQQVSYARQPDGSFVGAPGALSTLSAVTGGYDLVRADQVKYHFDSNGRLLSMRDRNGQGVTLAYDTAGNLATVTDAAGRVATFTSGPDGTLGNITLPDGRSVSYGYTAGRLTSVTDPLGKTTTFTYDSAGRMATEVDQNNHTVVANVYDSAGRVSQQTDARGNTTTFAWDPATQTETVTDARGNVWKDVYVNNVLVKRIDPTGDVTQFDHDAGLDPTSVTAPSGATTTMSYDAHGNLLSATAPASLGSVQKTFTYDAKNDVTSVTDARGKITSYGYDAAGNNTSITLAGQTVAGNTYSSAGQLTSSSDGNGKTTNYGYDASGNLTSVTDPLGNKTTYTYDGAGRVLTRVDPLGNVTGGTPAAYTTSYTYDGDGRLLTETDSLGKTTTYSYDAAGNQLTVTDANNHTTTNAYNAANQLTSVTAPDPDGPGPLAAPVTTYTYDAAGNRLTVTDANNHTTAYGYNADNQLTSVTTPKGEKTTYGYDANGNMTSSVDPRGNVVGAVPADYTTTYTYDAAGRLLSKTDPLNHTTSYSYDATGNQASVTDANNHTTSYTYDPAGRILTVTAPDSGITTYTYDGDGNILTRKDANLHTTTYTYDDAGHLASKTLPTGDQWTYRYDANGNLSSMVDANGNATLTAGDGTTSYSYDNDNRLKTIAYSDATPGVMYTYDAVGNRTAMSDGAGTVNYSYDNLNRLTAFTRGLDTFSYSYDPAGNITNRTYPDNTSITSSYDEDNRLTSVTSGGATTSYAYDAASNLTQTTLPASNGYTETRTYDKAGRLADVKNANATSTLSDYTYTLDPVGNPSSLTQTGAVTSTTTYSYDANDRLTSV